MILKGNATLGEFSDNEFEGKIFHKVQLLGGGEQLKASISRELKEVLSKLPFYSPIFCELDVKTYGAKTSVRIISAVPAKQ